MSSLIDKLFHLFDLIIISNEKLQMDSIEAPIVEMDNIRYIDLYDEIYEDLYDEIDDIKIPYKSEKEYYFETSIKRACRLINMKDFICGEQLSLKNVTNGYPFSVGQKRFLVFLVYSVDTITDDCSFKSFRFERNRRMSRLFK